MSNTDLTETLSDALLGVSALDHDEDLKSAHLHNALSLIHQALGEGSWVGLYLATPTRLTLGPFQGTPACEKIAFGKGVVGECYETRKTITVTDVTARPNYICCDAAAKVRSASRCSRTENSSPSSISICRTSTNISLQKPPYSRKSRQNSFVFARTPAKGKGRAR